MMVVFQFQEGVREKEREKKRTKRENCKQMGHKQKIFPPRNMVKKCTACNTTRTPQWREGPEGPKTLCNACGVKFSRDKGSRRKHCRKHALPALRIKSSNETADGQPPISLVEHAVEDVLGGAGIDQVNKASIQLPEAPVRAKEEEDGSLAFPRFNGADYQAASTMLQMGAGELQGSPNKDPSPTPSTPSGSGGLRRSLRVQLKRDRELNPPIGSCRECGGGVGGGGGRQSSPFSLMDRIFENGLEYVDLSGVPAQEMERITEAHVQVNMLRYELQGAEAVAHGAEQVYLCAKQNVESTRAQLNAAVMAFEKLTRKIPQSVTSNEPPSKKRHL